MDMLPAIRPPPHILRRHRTQTQSILITRSGEKVFESVGDQWCVPGRLAGGGGLCWCAFPHSSFSFSSSSFFLLLPLLLPLIIFLLLLFLLILILILTPPLTPPHPNPPPLVPPLLPPPYPPSYPPHTPLLPPPPLTPLLLTALLPLPLTPLLPPSYPLIPPLTLLPPPVTPPLVSCEVCPLFSLLQQLTCLSIVLVNAHCIAGHTTRVQ